jgi:beta-aspartyl-peptidase (threonine type)
VAAVTGIKNPILLARAVLDRGEYVLVSGAKARELAREEKIAMEDQDYFFTDMRYQQWQQVQQRGNIAISEGFGTVGAVALDQHGHLAAATSTGGLVNKAYGRIGDSCVIGAGTYANDASCAVSCTGDGEAFIRAVAAYDIASMLEYRQVPLPAACDEVLQKVLRLGGTGGLIAISRSGIIAMPFTSEGMYRACCHLNGRTEEGIF